MSVWFPSDVEWEMWRLIEEYVPLDPKLLMISFIHFHKQDFFFFAASAWRWIYVAKTQDYSVLVAEWSFISSVSGQRAQDMNGEEESML